MTEYFYLDSSVAIRILYGQSTRASAWFEKATGEATVFSSRLLRTELTRVLRRDNKPVARRDEILDYIGVIPVDDTIFAEADAILPHIKTLDAIHLASVIRSGLDATVVTHDDTMRSVAEQIGYATLDPVGG